MKKRLTFVDLFSGCGGLSEGFMQSKKFTGLAHVEWELPMVNTLRHRLLDKWKHSEDYSFKRVVHFDIQLTEELFSGNWNNEIQKKFGKTNHPDVIEKGLQGLIGKKNVDVVIGGPPCQAYSIAGRAKDPNSMMDDYRNYLFESFIEVVKKVDAKVFVFENVPGMLSACPGGELVTKRIYEAFDNAGYEIRKPDELKKCVYSAKSFGVPQERKRVIIVGVKKGMDFTHEDIYGALDKWLEDNKPDPKKITVHHALKKKGLVPLLPIANYQDEKKKNVSHKSKHEDSISKKQHNPRYHNYRDVEIFREWVENNWNARSLEEKREFYFKRTGKQSNHAKYRSLEWHKPAPTIVAHMNKDGLLFIHPDKEQARTLTVREAAILQSFPDDYEFKGTQGFCYKMIGNAVPPKMAEGIAYAVARVMKRS